MQYPPCRISVSLNLLLVLHVLRNNWLQSTEVLHFFNDDPCSQNSKLLSSVIALFNGRKVCRGYFGHIGNGSIVRKVPSCDTAYIWNQ